MKKNSLSSYTKGWIVGDFDPSLQRSTSIEVGVKRYKAGDVDKMHVHHIVTEHTVVVEGAVEMSGNRYVSGDIITVFPGEPVKFKAITDATLVVIKTPSIPSDKHIIIDDTPPLSSSPLK